MIIKALKQGYYNKLLCSFLFIKNFFYNKKLVVEYLLYPDNIAMRGNEIELNWKTSGCHKILIKNVGVIPGNLSFKGLLLNDKRNSLEIIFYGIKGQKEIKNIEIITNTPVVSNSFIPNINIPKFYSKSLRHHDSNKTFVNFIFYLESRCLTIEKLKTTSLNLRLNFKPYTKPSNPTKS